MEAANIVNTTCHEIVNIRNVYYEYFENVTNINKVKRHGSWRISSFELAVGSTFKKFNVDVTDWDIEETVNRTANGPVSGNRLKGFTPKLNEFVESYFNEFVRRPLVIVYETFNGEFYLYGGTSYKTRFSFKKAIAGRNGYDVEFISSNSESSLIIDDTDIFPAPNDVTNKVLIQVNGEDFVEVACGNSYDLIVKNEDDVQVGEKIGSEWIVPSGIEPSGVLFHFPRGQQYTSYRTGDEGWRKQNGWYNIVLPSNPKVIAKLDYSQGADAWYCLQDDLVVGGVSNKIRFVGVDGTQGFSTTGNKDYLLIDKLTGLGLMRNYLAVNITKTWNAAIDDALSYSIVVDGVTYSDFFLPSLEELLLIYGQYGNNTGPLGLSWQDTKNSVYLLKGSFPDLWTSTTVPINTARAYEINPNPNMNIRTAFDKTQTGLIYATYIFDARSLITAP